MERQITYSLGNRKNKFLETIEDSGFVYNHQTFEIRCEGLNEPLGIIINSHRGDYVILPQNLGKESFIVRNERKRLIDLADKFK